MLRRMRSLQHIAPFPSIEVALCITALSWLWLDVRTIPMAACAGEHRLKHVTQSLHITIRVIKVIQLDAAAVWADLSLADETKHSGGQPTDGLLAEELMSGKRNESGSFESPNRKATSLSWVLGLM